MLTMKRVYTPILYAALIIFALVQCDDINSNAPNPEEVAPIDLIEPLDNSTVQPLSTNLTWQKIDGAVSYRVLLSETKNFNNSVIDTTVLENSLTTITLKPKTLYRWKVFSNKTNTNGSWSKVRTFITGAFETSTSTLKSVVLISPVNNADKVSTNLTFTWEPYLQSTKYIYQLSDNITFSSVIKEETVTGTSFLPTILVHQKKYFWRVRPEADTAGNSWSEVWSFTTGPAGVDTGVITRVQLIAPVNNADKVSLNLTFSWKPMNQVTDYLYQLSDNSSFNSVIKQEKVSGTSYTPSGLVAQKKYYWRVRNHNDTTGESWSDGWSFTTGTQSTPPTEPPTSPPPTEPPTSPPPTEPPTSPPPTNQGAFVTVQNSDFVDNGSVMRFAGTNAYYLPNYEKLNPAVVDRAMDTFQDAGITVIRMWGFYDGYDCGYSKNDANENVIQTSPGVYSESALQDLDNVIAKGKEHGVRFIIPFINFWDQLGGVCQYNTWAGASNPSVNMQFFLTNSNTQKWYKDYIKMLLNRVNTVTGVAYKDEPAIMAWQIMNEGRNPGANPSVLRDWYRSIAQYIKSIDPNHLVSTGEEGFDEGTPSVYSVAEYSNTYALRANEGTSYVMNTAIPEIDFGNAHWYPAEYGFGNTINESLLKGQRAWLSDHKKIAENSGKPFMIGEFGFAGWGDDRVKTMYSALYQHAQTIQLDGNVLWQLTADGTKCWEFGGNICYPGGRADTELYNDFKNHITNLKNQR